jgi:hypothetical protein
MLAVDVITFPIIFVAAVLFFAALGIGSYCDLRPSTVRWSALSLLALVLLFVLYRQTAVYSFGIARGDYDFGFPFRWVTTQSDAGPYRFRLWALAADFGVGAAIWAAFHFIRRYRHSNTRNG